MDDLDDSNINDNHENPANDKVNSNDDATLFDETTLLSRQEEEQDEEEEIDSSEVQGSVEDSGNENIQTVITDSNAFDIRVFYERRVASEEISDTDPLSSDTVEVTGITDSEDTSQ